MRVFISWSGTISRLVAEALRDWIPFVLPAAEPWMSSTDIDRGTRWSAEVATHLDNANVGIVCLTHENLQAPWILFEAGALSKILSKSLVCTYLFHLRPADIKGPLAQFQATVADQSETKKLLVSMNRVLGGAAVPELRLDRAFERWWPDLESSFATISKQKPVQGRAVLSERELLEEILGLQRRSDSKLIALEIAQSVIDGLRSNLLNAIPDSGLLKANAPITHDDAFLIVDTKPLVGPNGKIAKIAYPVFGSVSDFLDELYAWVSSAVPPGFYGRLWVLRERHSGKVFKEMGRTWARKALNRKLDNRRLEEIGIGPGMRFEALHLHQAGAVPEEAFS